MGNNNVFDINYVLGVRIAFLRRERKISQDKLAKLCNVNSKYISDLERGTRNPTIKILAKIAYGLNISLSDLFNGIDVKELDLDI